MNFLKIIGKIYYSKMIRTNEISLFGGLIQK